MAMEDSGLKIDSSNAHRVGCLSGSGLGGLAMLLDTHKVLLEKGPSRISPFFIPGIIANMAPGQIAIEFGVKGPNISIETACAASSHAIGEAFRLIREGISDAVIAGGSEAVVNPLSLGGFCSMRALSRRNDDPEKASRPFDLDRDGFVMGEGAGILILEEREQALERGANIYAEVVGYGLTDHVSLPASGWGPDSCRQGGVILAGGARGVKDDIATPGTNESVTPFCKGT